MDRGGGKKREYVPRELSAAEKERWAQFGEEVARMVENSRLKEKVSDLTEALAKERAIIGYLEEANKLAYTERDAARAEVRWQKRKLEFADEVIGKLRKELEDIKDNIKHIKGKEEKKK